MTVVGILPGWVIGRPSHRLRRGRSLLAGSRTGSAGAGAGMREDTKQKSMPAIPAPAARGHDVVGALGLDGRGCRWGNSPWCAVRRVLVLLAAVLAAVLPVPLGAQRALAAGSADITGDIRANRAVTLAGDSVINLPGGTTTYTGVIGEWAP